MPVNNISGSNSTSPVDLYKINQSNNAAPSRPENPPQQVPKKEDLSVQISQEALNLQKQEQTRQVNTDEQLQTNRDVKERANQQIQEQQAEAKEYAAQQSIDIVV